MFYFSVYLEDYVIQNISMWNKYLLLWEYFSPEQSLQCSIGQPVAWEAQPKGKLTNSTGCYLLTELLWAQTVDCNNILINSVFLSSEFWYLSNSGTDKYRIKKVTKPEGKCLCVGYMVTIDHCGKAGLHQHRYCSLQSEGNTRMKSTVLE